MQTFSAHWLALREPADRAARNPDILAAVAEWCAEREALSVVDLASGTASSLRAIAPVLPPAHQRWTLIDNDAALLTAAAERLADWAAEGSEGDAAGTFATSAAETRARQSPRGPSSGVQRFERDGKTLVVDAHQASLERPPGEWLPTGAELIVASALFDLVSSAWIDRFVAELSARRLPLYAALNYDGDEQWVPPHRHDALTHAAFLRHQRRDKGFGPAAGPEAAMRLAEALRGAGYQVRVGPSPWRLTRTDAALIEPLAEGVATAAIDAAPEAADAVADWRKFRRATARDANVSVTVGHLDLWAVPEGDSRSSR